MQTLFADTILNLTVTGPLVRIDFGTVTQSAGQAGGQQLRATPTQQLVMPIQGFVRAFGMQENLVRQLIADGVLKAQPAETGQASAT